MLGPGELQGMQWLLGDVYALQCSFAKSARNCRCQWSAGNHITTMLQTPISFPCFWFAPQSIAQDMIHIPEYTKTARQYCCTIDACCSFGNKHETSDDDLKGARLKWTSLLWRLNHSRKVMSFLLRSATQSKPFPAGRAGG